MIFSLVTILAYDTDVSLLSSISSPLYPYYSNWVLNFLVSNSFKHSKSTEIGCLPHIVLSVASRYSENLSASYSTICEIPYLSNLSIYFDIVFDPLSTFSTRYMKSKLLPQWQKSDEITNKFSSPSFMYLANTFPYSCSLSLVRLPTNIGTILTLSPNTFFKYGKCISMECSSSSTYFGIYLNTPSLSNASLNSLSIVKSPNGVWYLEHNVNAHESKYTWWEGPRTITLLYSSGFNWQYAYAATWPL